MMRLPTSAALRATVTRAGRQATTSSAMITRAAASTHAISNPTLANIEKRWEGMPLQEQAELWMALRDRMKENWADLTLQEKKAGECATGAPNTAPSLPRNGLGAPVGVLSSFKLVIRHTSRPIGPCRLRSSLRCVLKTVQPMDADTNAS